LRKDFSPNPKNRQQKKTETLEIYDLLNRHRPRVIRHSDFTDILTRCVYIIDKFD